MGIRDNLISRSILRAIFKDPHTDKRTVLSRIFAFFTFFQLSLARYKDEVFKKLRDDVWEMDEAEYRESFRGQDRTGKLKSVGDLGYSGSVLNYTNAGDYKYLTPSVDLLHHSEREVPHQIPAPAIRVYIFRPRPARTIQ
jgi:hypothetical protein